MKIENMLTENDKELLEAKKIITVNNGVLLKNSTLLNNGTPLITEANIYALNVGPLTYVTPQAVEVLTAPISFDRFIGDDGIKQQGQFGQDTIAIKTLERTGVPQAYVDGTTLSPGFHLADVNYTAETVGIAYRDTGYQASALELSSAQVMGVDLIQDKIRACMEGLSIDRNNINWLGTTETRGLADVYGLLNNPQLFDYVELPAGVSGSTEWESKTFMEIYNDIIFMINTLTQQSKGWATRAYESGRRFKLGVSMNVYNYLSKTNEFGVLVSQAIENAYRVNGTPAIEIFGIPEMNNYAGYTTVDDEGNRNGENMAILMIDALDGIKTAYSSYVTLAQFFKIYENAGNISQRIVAALSGTIVNRPILISRFKGL